MRGHRTTGGANLSPKRITVKVPATTANLGPGFDSLGLALGLFNVIEVWCDDAEPHHVEGEGRDSLPTGPDNLVRQSMAAAAEHAGLSLPPVGVRQANEIPLARGLGSSSAAIIAGGLAANEYLGRPLSDEQLLALAVGIEGHPDNVAPALYGGMTVCYARAEGTGCLRLRPVDSPRAVLAIPDFEVATERARQALPQTVTHADAVLNVGHAAAVVTCFATGDYAALADALDDRLHQPYRAPLVPGMGAAIAAAKAAGAYGAALSGSGPTIVAFAHQDEDAIATAMQSALAEAGVSARTLVVDVCDSGAVGETPMG